MSETEFYQPGDPEYNPNDPKASRKDQIAKEIEDLEKGKYYLQQEIDRLYQKLEEEQ